VKEQILYKNIDEKDIRKILAGQHPVPVILVFTNDWLGASQILDRFFKDLAQKYQRRIHIYRCDAAKMNGLSKEIGLKTIPTTLILKSGQIEDHFTGILSKKKIEEKIQKLLGDRPGDSENRE
jgi:thioredoxin 1